MCFLSGSTKSDYFPQNTYSYLYNIWAKSMVSILINRREFPSYDFCSFDFLCSQASISVFAVSGFGIIWYLLNHISISVVLTERERNQHKDELYLADWGEWKLNVCQRITIERFSVYFGRSEYYLNNDSSSFHWQLCYDLFLFASSLIYEVNFFSSTFIHSSQD